MKTPFEKMKKRIFSGFSLIELIVVLAIIGILAVIAVPAYNNYLMRGKYTAIPTYLGSFKSDISEYYAINGSFPTSLNGCVATASCALANPSTYPFVKNFTYNTGTKNSVPTAWWCFRLNDFVETAGTCLAAVPESDGSLTFYCGVWDASADKASTVLSRLPSSCQSSVNQKVL